MHRQIEGVKPNQNDNIFGIRRQSHNCNDLHTEHLNRTLKNCCWFLENMKCQILNMYSLEFLWPYCTRNNYQIISKLKYVCITLTKICSNSFHYFLFFLKYIIAESKTEFLTFL